MGKKVIIIIFLLTSLSLIVFVVYGWIKIKSSQKEREAKIAKEVQVTPSLSPREYFPGTTAELPVLKEPPVGLFLALPVDKKYLEKALLDKENPQVLSFFLDPETQIRAVFAGKITSVFHNVKPFPNNNPFEEIRLERTDGEFWASYVIFGEVLVKEGDVASQGAILAKAKEGGLGFRSGTNLSVWIHDKTGEFIKLSKEMFR